MPDWELHSDTKALVGAPSRVAWMLAREEGDQRLGMGRMQGSTLNSPRRKEGLCMLGPFSVDAMSLSC